MPARCAATEGSCLAALTIASCVAAAGAFILYVELRKEWFPAPVPEILTRPLEPDASRLQVLYRELLLPMDARSLPITQAAAEEGAELFHEWLALEGRTPY